MKKLIASLPLTGKWFYLAVSAAVIAGIIYGVTQ